jgi:hypothetical protein
MSVYAVTDILAEDETWDRVTELLGPEGYSNFYDNLVSDINERTIQRFYVYTRRGGQLVHSIPLADTGFDAILAYRPHPGNPGSWVWVVERIVEHRANKLAQLSPVEGAILRAIGPWVGE